MEEIIKSLSQKLDLSEDAVRSGIGVVLRFLKERTDGALFDKVVAQVPGAKAFMDAAPEQAGSGAGGMLSGLLGAAGGFLGGQGGDLAKALGALQQAGIPMDKAAPLVEQFLEQARGIVGPETVDALLSNAPALKSLFGGKAA